MVHRIVVAAALTALVACGSKSQTGLVRAEVQRLEDGRDVKIEIEKAELEPIAGLELYNATVLVPDHPGYRCAVSGKQVWCTGDDRLARVVKALGLGSSSDQLTAATWIELAAFLLEATPLRTPGKADLLASYAPAEAQQMIRVPGVSRGTEGIVIDFFTERVMYSAYPSGPMSLVRIRITVLSTNTVSITREAVWDSSTSEPAGEITTDDDKACASLGQAAAAAAAAGASCTTDDECAIRDIGLCNVDGLGCHWITHSTTQPTKPVDDAIAAYIAGCNRLSKCDCPVAPTTATCVDGTCTEAR